MATDPTKMVTAAPIARNLNCSIDRLKEIRRLLLHARQQLGPGPFKEKHVADAFCDVGNAEIQLLAEIQMLESDVGRLGQNTGE